ncbi:hypothetical protein [Pseudomonas aeruginosa]|uniref:hypothetical protein n=1 Tax=Pseudomonas aeruginosa TaxID=287 RepID=UPI001F091BA9|nr:hypothetical protein [Pseudomonas aeruginosa]
MSSTQLIEQCATRLRGIVEALDNIHDNTPHRWSTDLDEVHSSAESLLAMIKDQAPARSETSFEEWLANELEGEDGQPVPAAVCDIALARRAFNHWPKLEQPAKVGGVRFSAGVSSRLVVEAAQRLYEFESTPEKEAERIERLQAFREQLDPLNLAPHAEAFNEAPAEALKSEQAEAERAACERWITDQKLCQGSDISLFRLERNGELVSLHALLCEAYQAGQVRAAAEIGKEVPQAWLDVQAERKRQVEVEGWTPEHDDAHSHGQMARAAACYALAGSSAPNDGTAALLVSLAWPWDEQWWKPSTARRDMVKACALGLAEIERLDRAAASQGGPSDA